MLLKIWCLNVVMQLSCTFHKLISFFLIGERSICCLSFDWRLLIIGSRVSCALAFLVIALLSFFWRIISFMFYYFSVIWAETKKKFSFEKKILRFGIWNNFFWEENLQIRKHSSILLGIILITHCWSLNFLTIELLSNFEH